MKGSLGNGRNWSTLPLDSDKFEWSMEDEQSMVQGPHKMEPMRDQWVSLSLEMGQYALLIRDGGLKALYLDGCHHLDIGEGKDQVKTDSLLLFLDTTKSADFRWTEAGANGFATDDGTPVISHCSVRIEKPARFYQHVLRELDDWSSKSLNNHLENLVHEAFNNLLTEIREHCCDHPGGLQSTLMGLGAHQLDEHLSEHGLYCVSLAAYTAAPPVDDCIDQTAGQSTDLLHN